jgi:DNA repair protein RecO (recombination protein O)
MPIEQSEAIVLRSFDVVEQDKIVIFFSRDKGIIKGIAKGARKFGNRFGSSREDFQAISGAFEVPRAL